jgi:hypothetical protein
VRECCDSKKINILAVVDIPQVVVEGVVKILPLVEKEVEAAAMMLVLEVHHLHNMVVVVGDRQDGDDTPHDQLEEDGLHLALWVVVDQVVRVEEG